MMEFETNQKNHTFGKLLKIHNIKLGRRAYWLQKKDTRCIQRRKLPKTTYFGDDGSREALWDHVDVSLVGASERPKHI
jgi:hypothetical protein